MDAAASSSSYFESYVKVDTRTFVYEWKIADIDLVNNAKLCSKPFPEDNEDYGQWCIEFNPFANGYVDVFVCRLNRDKRSLSVRFKLSVLGCGGSSVLLCCKSVGDGSRVGFRKMFEREKIVGSSPEYTTNNELHLSCEVTVGRDSYFYSKDPEDIQVPECSLSDDLWTVFSDKKSADVLLIVDEVEFPAHSIILSARSPVFEAMFQHEMSERTTKRVNIPDIDPEVMLEVLRFIYSGKVEKIESIARDLLMAADKYALKRLKKLCEKCLAHTVSPRTAAETLLLSETYRASNLRSHVVKHIRKNKDRVIQSSGWKDLMISNPDAVAKVLQEILVETPPKKAP